MKKILPIVLVLFSIVAGLGAGHMLKPAPEKSEDADVSDSDMAKKDSEKSPDDRKETKTYSAMAAEPKPVPAVDDGPVDFVKLEKQFVVPVISGERVESLMVISIALETIVGASDTVFAFEPKLRDELLRALFVHAQSGGFSGPFTEDYRLRDLRESLRGAAALVLGDLVKNVLLTNIVRQDI